jgi:hypothetical protein
MLFTRRALSKICIQSSLTRRDILPFGAEVQLLTISEEKAKGQEKHAARRKSFTTEDTQLAGGLLTRS